LVRLRFNDQLEPQYLRFLLATPPYRRLLSSMAKPAGGQANISVDEFKAIEIEYVTVECQRAIISRLNGAMETNDAMTRAIANGKASIAAVLRAIWEE
jgi:hypothetical protein